MKNNKFSKIALAIVVLALCVGAVFAMNISAEESAADTKKPEIISQNIEYSSMFKLMYAVDASTVAEGAVTLRVYSTEPTDAATPVATMVVSEATPAAQTGNLNKDAYIFTTTAGISYTEMTTNYYAVAEDAEGNKSDVKRYSVAEYLYERLASGEAKEKQEKFYNNTIAFGASAQEVLAKENETPVLVSDYRYVAVEGGTIDGYSAGIYPIGTVLTPAAEGAISAKWAVTTTDAEGKETVTNNNTSYTVIDAVKAVLSVGTKLSYREGTDNFDDDTNVNTGYIWWATASKKQYGELVSESGRGNVVKFDFVKDDAGLEAVWASFDKNNSLVSDENATAFEMSFDIKAICNSAEGAGATQEIQLSAMQGSNTAFKFGYYMKSGTSAGLYLNEGSTGNPKVTYDDIDPAGWVHIRMVVYYDQPEACYIYVNGELALTSTTIISSNYKNNMTGINKVKISCPDRALGSAVYFDNVFVGNIIEDNPTK